MNNTTQFAASSDEVCRHLFWGTLIVFVLASASPATAQSNTNTGSFVIETIVSNLNLPGPITLQDQMIVWSEYPVILKKMMATGGNITTLTQINYYSDSSARGISTDSNRVYVSVNPGGYGAGAIYSVPLSGGASVWLANANQPTDISCDASNVFWAEENGGGDTYTGIRRVSKTGGAVATLSTQGYESKLATAAGFVYFSKSESDCVCSPANSTLCRVPVYGGNIEVLVTNWASSPYDLDFVGPIAVGGGYIYWGSSKGNVSKISISGANASILYTGSNSINKVLIEGNQIFWIEDEWNENYDNLVNWLRVCSVNGGDTQTIASGRFQGLAASVDYLYVTSSGANSQNGSILRVQRPPVLSVLPTNRLATIAETTPPTSFPPPLDSQFKTFVGGVFTTNAPPPNTNRMTIVLTHGWKSNPEAWSRNMAGLILNNVATIPNIVTWDWNQAASSNLLSSARNTQDQGLALGQVLFGRLGVNYAHRIHFIGHSLGTLVNSKAADYLHANGFAWTNTQVTLFDEAEIAVGLDANKWKVFSTLVQANLSTPQSFYGQPLPKRCFWVDNFVAAFGLLHREAANVILTNGFPTSASDFPTWWDALISFHGYPYQWYDETITTDISAMGHRWSFERGGFVGAPGTNTVYIQNGSDWNLTQTTFADGTNFLNERIGKYLGALYATVGQVVNNTMTANGQVMGEMQATGPANAWNVIIHLFTSDNNGSFSPMGGGPEPQGARDGADSTLPALAWIPLGIPSNAVSMTFDFKIQGDWKDDSLATAWNGTNVLLLAASQIETNLLLSSGPIDVSAFAGQTNEFFVGIVGGKSTNAQLTVRNIQFFNQTQPSLQAQAIGNNFVLTWPISATDYHLEMTDNFTTTNSWTTVTNGLAIMNLQNAVTNGISGSNRFYRLRKP